MYGNRSAVTSRPNQRPALQCSRPNTACCLDQTDVLGARSGISVCEASTGKLVPRFPAAQSRETLQSCPGQREVERPTSSIT